jgi:hypothetical protein
VTIHTARRLGHPPNVCKMAVRPFSFDEEPALYCIFDVPGLHMDACFDRERFQGGVIEIKEKIALWGQMDLHSAAADIARVYSAHDYNPRANSWPQSSLAFFSPLLSRLCVCSLLTTSALYAFALLQFLSCVLFVCSVANRNSWHCCRARCGASEELRAMLQRSLQGVDQAVTWWHNFKELRRINRRGLEAIGKCIDPVRDTQGRDAAALLHLRREVQVIHDAVAAHEPAREQQYVFAYINEFLASIPVDGPVDDIAPILESFDNLALAFYTMSQFPNERERFDWIVRYRPQDAAVQRRFDELYPEFISTATGYLSTIRSKISADRPSARLFFASIRSNTLFLTCTSDLRRTPLKVWRSLLVFPGTHNIVILAAALGLCTVICSC